MRQTNKWWRPLYDELKNSLGKDDVPDSAPTLFRVECGLWLSIRLDIPPVDLWATIGLSDFIDANWTDGERRFISIARYYLSDDRHSWRAALELYRNFEPKFRLYDLSEDLSDATSIYPPSAYTLNRENFYSSLLSTPLEYKTVEIQAASCGQRYRYKVKNNENQRFVRDVYVPEEWSDFIGDWAVPDKDQLYLKGKPSKENICIHFDQLAEIASFLDNLEEASVSTKSKLSVGNWKQRLSSIQLRLFNSQNQLEISRVLELSGNIHLPGTLSVGKSTLAFLISVWCVINQYRITLILNDVSSILSMANELNQHLLHPLVLEGKISLPNGLGPRAVESTTRGATTSPIAVPILGKTSRDKHVKQLYQDTFEDAAKMHSSHASHWGWRWLDTKCAIDALSSDAGDFRGPIPLGQEPCERLLLVDENNSDDDINGSSLICPLLGKCPVHQASRDLPTAFVWLTSPAALISSYVSRNITSKRITYYELVYRCSDVVIVDECDQAQSNIDGLFLPVNILAGPGQTHLLNDLTQRVASMRSDKRSLHENSSRRWVRAVEIANIVTDQIYDVLTSPETGQIRNWIGDGIFWNMNLFAIVLWDLLEIDSTETTAEQRQLHEKLLNRLSKFVSSPLQSDEWDNDELLADLGQIAQILITSGHGAGSKQKCIKWISKARETFVSKKLDSSAMVPRVVESTTRGPTDLGRNETDPLKDTQYWDSLAGRLEFVILVSILDDQLTLVELDWGSAPELLNLDAYSSLQDRDKELRPVLPPPPTGRIFGFQYKREKFHPANEGILRRIRFPAMGRWALLHLHDLFLATDGVAGPHVLMLSGTSWSPMSPFFHVDQKPAGVLEAVTEKPIVSEWIFRPTTSRTGKFLSISGSHGNRRQEILEHVSAALAQSGGALDETLRLIKDKSLQATRDSDDKSWQDRERILLLTGSYEESALVASMMHQTQPNLKVCQMIRSGASADEDDENDITWLNLSTQKVGHADVNRFALLYPDAKVLVAPIDAVGRGRNILNKNKVAAFGCIVFLVRSLLPPNDPASDARRLMFWSQKNFPIQIERTDFGACAEKIRQDARNEWHRLLINKQTWVEMASADREMLASTLFTRMWQAIGRGIRGNVPVVVLFVDSKWAPESTYGREDTPETSLLMAMQECFTPYLTGRKGNTFEQQLAKALYTEPLDGIKNIRGMIVEPKEI